MHTQRVRLVLGARHELVREKVVEALLGRVDAKIQVCVLIHDKAEAQNMQIVVTTVENQSTRIACSIEKP
jgi:hypothetical protein